MPTNIGDFKSKMQDPFLLAALHQARMGLADKNGIPIGAALVIDGVVAGLGYNQRFAKGQPGAARRNGVPGKRRPLEGS